MLSVEKNKHLFEKRIKTIKTRVNYLDLNKNTFELSINESIVEIIIGGQCFGNKELDEDKDSCDQAPAKESMREDINASKQENKIYEPVLQGGMCGCLLRSHQNCPSI